MENHTISKFSEKPNNDSTWKGMWFGVSSLFIPPLLGILSAFSRLWLDPVSMEGRSGLNFLGAGMGGIVSLLALILAFFGIKFCLRAYKLGERSWIMWLGFVPAALTGLFWLVMIGGEILIPH